ncbi:lytic transglycosylase domain-containing protein [Dehalobacter restrictus]|uniref:Transglycosylase SLT domain-containing protein n=1 Tax=Dehalobacter restrictus TaxID=55583 RepID=A0A857DGR4_9FIRM|nr:lytic transglycosylase domain-containing protein [Dehalobacter restrictus]QHA00097.1 transglycosylase SLT domain-containing protein [Dehalobacter restrictus]
MKIDAQNELLQLQLQNMVQALEGTSENSEAFQMVYKMLLETMQEDSNVTSDLNIGALGKKLTDSSDLSNLSALSNLTDLSSQMDQTDPSNTSDQMQMLYLYNLINLQNSLLNTGDGTESPTRTGDFLGTNNMPSSGQTYNSAYSAYNMNNMNNTNNTDSSFNASSIDASIKAAITEASEKYGVEKSLISAVIRQESSFNPNAVSSAGAIGLMQLMPATATGLGVTDPFNIEQNVDGGTRYLRQLIDRYGSTEMALAAYNAGSGTIRARGVQGPEDLVKMPAETRNFVQNVMSYYTGRSA